LKTKSETLAVIGRASSSAGRGLVSVSVVIRINDGKVVVDVAILIAIRIRDKSRKAVESVLNELVRLLSQYGGIGSRNQATGQQSKQEGGPGEARGNSAVHSVLLCLLMELAASVS
jgi:hypothetical protein